jgi:hypothetical protein
LYAEAGRGGRFDPASGQPGERLREETLYFRRVIDQELLDQEVRDGEVELDARHRQ